MTTKATVIMVLIMAVVGVLVVYCSYHLSGDEKHYSADKLVMYSEQEYIDFKNELARDDVSITSCDVINHTPPYIVSFKVEVLDGGKFLYGVDITSRDNLIIATVAVAVYIVACWIFYSLICPIKSQE
jgi:hypothetical protein